MGLSALLKAYLYSKGGFEFGFICLISLIPDIAEIFCSLWLSFCVQELFPNKFVDIISYRMWWHLLHCASVSPAQANFNHFLFLGEE